MKIIERMKADLEKAKIDKDPIAVSTLPMAIREATLADKDPDNKVVTETIKRIISLYQSTAEINDKAGRDRSVMDQRIAVLRSYLPRWK